MKPFVKNIYLALCSRPKTPKEKAQLISMVQDIIATDEGYEFMEKHCRRGNNYLYAAYMKERVKRIFEKVNGGGGITI